MQQPPTINGRLPATELQAEILKSITLYGKAVVAVDDNAVVVTHSHGPHTVGGLTEWLKRHPPIQP